MEHYSENCMICGNPLIYHDMAQNKKCHICGTECDTNTCCTEGHYICDNCHSEKGLLLISFEATNSMCKNPIEIATSIMKNKEINMHGPEHHYLVAASLLAAYKNAGGQVDFDSALHSALQRAKNVPGGICGLWGSCGAGIATGIFISIITGATPLSETEWSMANQMTSRSLNVIAENGGPRCCKRNSYLAIYQAVTFLAENFDIVLELPEQIICEFSLRNSQCRKSKCLYFQG